MRVEYTVFTKCWSGRPLTELAGFVKCLGFDGVELPVRPGAQVTPDNMASDLPRAVQVLAEHGLKIGSVAGILTEATIAAMGAAGLRILRICAAIDLTDGYRKGEEKLRREFDALIPMLDRHGVTIGLQNHSSPNMPGYTSWCIGPAIGLMHLIEDYDPRHVGAVLDVAHSGLDGEPDIMAIDIVWSHLLLINLKSALWVPANGPEAEEMSWRPYWTDGRHGIASWKIVADELKRRDYSGDVCLSAQYTAKGDVDRLIAADLAYARSLFDR